MYRSATLMYTHHTIPQQITNAMLISLCHIFTCSCSDRIMRPKKEPEGGEATRTTCCRSIAPMEFLSVDVSVNRTTSVSPSQHTGEGVNGDVDESQGDPDPKVCKVCVSLFIYIND